MRRPLAVGAGWLFVGLLVVGPSTTRAQSAADAESAERGAEAAAPADVTELDLEALLNTTVSTASKREQSIAAVPVAVTVFSADDIEGTGQLTLCDALQYSQLSCRRGAMRKSVIGVRGLSSNFLSNRMLLLKDGRPETDPWTGIFYPDETTPLVNVKKVEVLRGPGSSMYGSNAFGGVINLVTRRPDDLIREGHHVGADVRAMAGQWGTYRAQATAAGKAGGFGGLVNYYGLRSDGPQLLNDPSRGIVDRNEWTRVQHVSGRATYASATVDVGYTNANIGRPGGKVFTTVGNCGRCHYTPNDSEAVESFNASATVDQKISDALSLVAEGYVNFKRREVFLQNQITRELQPSLGKRRRVGVEARGVYTTRPVTLTAGADLKLDAVNNRNVLEGLTPDDLGATIAGVFVDAEARPINRWLVFAGLRYDQIVMSSRVWQRPSSHLSPRAAIIFQPVDPLSLTARYGHSFRAPSLAELAINQQMYGATLIGNPQLTAETMDSFELAADYWVVKNQVKLSATGFYEYARNLIDQEFLFGSLSQFQNGGSARILGAEAETSLFAPSVQSRVDLGYQYLRARSVGGPGGAQPLDYAPEHRFFLRGHTARGERLFFDLYALFVASRQDPGFLIDPATGAAAGHVRLPPYLTVSARAGVNLAEGLSASLLATNLFDAQYEESLGFPAPGLGLFGEIKFTY